MARRLLSPPTLRPGRRRGGSGRGFGRIDTHRGGIRTVLPELPDVPFDRFELSLKGGSKGLLQNAVDLCRSKPRANVTAVSHSAARLRSSPRLTAGC